MALVTKNFSDKSMFNPAFKLNAVNVAQLGQLNSLLQAAGVTINMGGLDDLGKRIVIGDADAADWASAAVGTLFGGIYQAVQVDSGATGANIFPGAAAYLLDTATGGAANSGSQGYVVTDSAHAVTTGNGCGVFLNAITPGNFGFICVGGKVLVKYTAAVTSVSQASTVVFGGATAGTFDAIVAAITGITLPTIAGVPLEAPANAGLLRVQLKLIFGRF